MSSKIILVYVIDKW